MTDKTIYLYDDVIGRVEYVQHVGSDKMCVNAARVSFGAENDFPIDEKDEKLISYLIKHRHTSPFEHSLITFKFTVPLFIRSQHHRHRVWNFNEISRRYTSENIKFYEPLQFRTQHKSNRQASNTSDLINPIWDAKERTMLSTRIEHHHEECLCLYNDMMEAGVCREQARGVLPQNMYTSYYGSVDMHNLLKFVSLRTHEGAQWEIVKVAEACLKIAEGLFPVTVKAWRENVKEKG